MPTCCYHGCKGAADSPIGLCKVHLLDKSLVHYRAQLQNLLNSSPMGMPIPFTELPKANMIVVPPVEEEVVLDFDEDAIRVTMLEEVLCLLRDTFIPNCVGTPADGLEGVVSAFLAAYGFKLDVTPSGIHVSRLDGATYPSYWSTQVERYGLVKWMHHAGVLVHSWPQDTCGCDSGGPHALHCKRTGDADFPEKPALQSDAPTKLVMHTPQEVDPVPDNKLYMFTDPKFIGRSFALPDDSNNECDFFGERHESVKNKDEKFVFEAHGDDSAPDAGSPCTSPAKPDEPTAVRLPDQFDHTLSGFKGILCNLPQPKSMSAAQISTLTEAWAAAYGNPADPLTKARIARTAADLREKREQAHRKPDINEMTNCIEQISHYLHRIEGVLNIPPSNELKQQMSKLQLISGGLISKQTRLKSIGTDFKEEVRKMMEEQAYEAEQRKAQATPVQKDPLEQGIEVLLADGEKKLEFFKSKVHAMLKSRLPENPPASPVPLSPEAEQARDQLKYCVEQATSMLVSQYWPKEYTAPCVETQHDGTVIIVIAPKRA